MASAVTPTVSYNTPESDSCSDVINTKTLNLYTKLSKPMNLESNGFLIMTKNSIENFVNLTL